MARYYHLLDKNEVLFVAPPLPPDVVELPPENVFWSELPEGHELTFDGGGLPNGTQLIVQGTDFILRDALSSAGVTRDTLTSALYLAGRGVTAPLTALDNAIDALVISEGVTLEEMVGAIQ